MSRELRLTYRALLKNPGDKLTMLAVADLLEEIGNESLARAYRWGAENGKWPGLLYSKMSRLFPQGEGHPIWDWDSEERETFLEDKSRLPHSIYEAIKRDDTRRYGGVNKAFRNLSRALDRVDANRLGSTAD